MTDKRKQPKPEMPANLFYRRLRERGDENTFLKRGRMRAYKKMERMGPDGLMALLVKKGQYFG